MGRVTGIIYKILIRGNLIATPPEIITISVRKYYYNYLMTIIITLQLMLLINNKCCNITKFLWVFFKNQRNY